MIMRAIVNCPLVLFKYAVSCRQSYELPARYPNNVTTSHIRALRRRTPPVNTVCILEHDSDRSR